MTITKCFRRDNSMWRNGPLGLCGTGLVQLWDISPDTNRIYITVTDRRPRGAHWIEFKQAVPYTSCLGDLRVVDAPSNPLVGTYSTIDRWLHKRGLDHFWAKIEVDA